MKRLAEILRKREPVVNVLTPAQSVADAIRTMAERHVGAVLIVEAGKLIGIFSERDLLHRVASRGLDPATELRAVMTPDPVTATPEEARTSAIQKMRRAGCRHLPVLLEGQIVDTLSIRDLLFAELDERDVEIDQLKRYIRGEA